jgi:hypothetical protein
LSITNSKIKTGNKFSTITRLLYSLAKAKPETASSQLVTLIEAPLPWFPSSGFRTIG